MIPYDDLVIALTTWRARQGLPVGQLSGALTPPPPAPRTAPPSAPPQALRTGYSGPNTAPPPLASPDAEDVDDAALLEEAQYDNEGNDFAMAFGGAPEHDGESTAIGGPPRPSDGFGGMTVPESGPHGGGARGVSVDYDDQGGLVDDGRSDPRKRRGDGW